MIKYAAHQILVNFSVIVIIITVVIITITVTYLLLILPLAIFIISITIIKFLIYFSPFFFFSICYTFLRKLENEKYISF